MERYRVETQTSLYAVPEVIDDRPPIRNSLLPITAVAAPKRWLKANDPSNSVGVLSARSEIVPSVTLPSKVHIVLAYSRLTGESWAFMRVPPM